LQIGSNARIEVRTVAWSNACEALTSPNEGEPLHMSASAQGSLDGAWLAFPNLAAAHSPEHPLATMLDYARFYGLRTMGALTLNKETLAALRPETFALDLVLVHNSQDAARLRETWLAQNFDVERAPAIRSLSGAIGVSDILKSVPRISRLVALVGSLGGSNHLFSGCAASGVDLQYLRWSAAVSALSPVARDEKSREPCAGDWAALALASCRDGGEAMEIIDVARGLGFKIAVLVGSEKLDPEFGRFALDGADLTLFSTEEQRNETLSAAFRFNDKIALLRNRWRVAGVAAAMLAEIHARRSRTNFSGRLERPRRIYFFASEDGAGWLAPEVQSTIEKLGVSTALVSLGEQAEALAGTSKPPAIKDWLLVDIRAPMARPDILRQTKKSGKKIAAIFAGFENQLSDAISPYAVQLEALCCVDAILPTSWRVAAELIRALALAGLRGPKIIPCPITEEEASEGEAAKQNAIDWDRYAASVLRALARTNVAPGWPLSVIAEDRPLLSCAITTYNRAPWLKHSLKLLLDAAAPWRDRVEIVVCDNASTDDTPAVAAKLLEDYSFRYYRNPENVGMLGNLGATARHCKGAYVWILGDDDLVVAEGLEIILKGLEENPEVEMAYLNYGYTRFDEPETLSDPGPIIDKATPIGFGGANRRVERLADVAAFNENLFTAIYACVFRRDHALRAYQLDTRGAPFSSLNTCVPSSVYALSVLQDRPAYWVGFPAIVVNMNVSWMRWALLWHLERMPDLHDLAELSGVDPARIDRHRFKHCWNAGEWAREAYFEAEEPIRAGFSAARLIERCKHIEIFHTQEIAKVMEAYKKAWSEGRVTADDEPPEALIARYGLSLEPDLKN
jgi:hypothetical protein